MGKDRVQIVCEARKNCPDLADACAVARNAVQRAHGISIGKATVVSQRELIKTSSGKVARRVRSRRLHAVDATRGHLTMTWVVSFLISRPFDDHAGVAELVRPRVL